MMGKIIDAINNIPPQLSGVLMSIVMSAIRILYDKKETKPQRIIIESLLCGALTMTFCFGIMALGLSIYWAVFVGGTIGYLGPNVAREYLIRVLDRKTKMR